MEKVIRFQVVPYALLDVLEALENTRINNCYIEYGVTKEDNNLVVWVRKQYHGELCKDCEAKGE